MPQDKNCKLLQPNRSTGQKKQKKITRKKPTAAENTEKLLPVSLSPETSSVVSPLPPQSVGLPQGQPPVLRAASKKDRERGDGTPTKVTELSVQARESLRWEGVLQDPQAEAKRLETYRANRRQRYMAHREALLKETRDALRQTFPKESGEKKASTEPDQHETVTLLHLTTD